MPLRTVDNPPNPWGGPDVEYLGEPPTAALQVFEDHSRSIVSKNDSPDLGFDYSVNPYRGCTHACAYCYARPTHTYLDLGAGTDFDRKIVVKPRAAELLRAVFDRKSWRGGLLLFSGVTDCYQPLEASYKITRACLQVCAEYRNPVGIITKAPLIERDIDVLTDLAGRAHLAIAVSIPIWDRDVARIIEPGAATPQRRIEIVRRLAAAGLDVTVNVGPIIPGLSDADIPRILEAAADAGAKYAVPILLRLPGVVADVFASRLREGLPLRAERVLSRQRDIRGGQLNDSRWKRRMVGEGPHAEAIARLFAATAARLGLDTMSGMVALSRASTFVRPPRPGEQLGLAGL
ncbi:MAG: PA0069 family radical SAM protein [Nannocystaceae bacterium]|nr:PA0069 family radical SAM protein [Nannocystaceae bacterium]